MNNDRRKLLALTGASLVTAPFALSPGLVFAAKREPYKEDEVYREAKQFFKTGAQELSDVLAKVLKEKGPPSAIIKGTESGGAIGVGLRYGNGQFGYRGGGGRKVYWQGPSIGFDVGGNAVKVFALVYDLPNEAALFRRHPGVDGSLYFVGGFGVNYVQRDKTVIAPVRFGIGWRQGINLGYMNFSREKRLNPF
jgi:hypothetical protein